MSKRKQSFENINSKFTKQQKKVESLQELLHIRPDLKGKKVYFFPRLNKYFEGVLFYDAKEKKAYVYSVINDYKYETFSQWMVGLKNRGLYKGYRSALATIFLEPNPSGPSIGSILRSKSNSYWKVSTYANIQNILSLIKRESLTGGKFMGTVIREISKGLELHFFNNKKKLEKKILIFAQGIFLSYKVWVFDQVLKEVDLPFPVKAMKRTLDEISNLMQYVFSLKVCCGQSTVGFENVVQIRGDQLVSNDKEHTPFAFLENKNQPDEAYRHIHCKFIIKDENTCDNKCENCQKLYKTMQQIYRRSLAGVNSVKIAYASKEILIEKIEHQKKLIKTQYVTLANIRDCLQKKIENEGGEISDNMSKITHTVIENVINKNIDISSLHPIFQELIRIQSEKPNGTRYHLMFLRWAISVYSKSGKAAYNVMKTIMRLPSISTLKNYINEGEQFSGWQDKTAFQILESLTTNNIWGYRRAGFFSHDSFKIQKDFEDEMQDYQLFALQCQNEIHTASENNNLLPNSITKKQEQNLATQVHQIVWHSTTHNFAFPIAYYGINTITAHNLNTLLFNLAARLECIGIHTYGSICDGAGENRTHIKSFDWYASTWSSGDIVEVNFHKDKKSFHTAKIIDSNYVRTKFTVCLRDCNESGKFTIDRTYIRPPMHSKSKWDVNEICEFKSPKDDQWYLGKITNFDSIESTLSIEITNAEGASEGWKVFNYHIDKFLRPVYDDQKLIASHKTVNPITGDEWFFISDPTHVFKKLRNNLSKSHTGEKNAREIMYNRKEISWKHIRGIYEHTNKHAMAKATKLTKRHIWLTSWSKMRVDLVEHTLSKEVENALAFIKKHISGFVYPEIIGIMVYILPPTPISPISFTEDILQCSICKKTFKSKRGLSQHKAIIRRYNSSRVGFYKLPKNFINEFKKTLVFLIHRQLPCHFTKIGLKAVTVACTESQFFATFGGNIHHYFNKSRVYNNFGGDQSDDIDTEEENPLDRKRKFKIYSQRNSRYKRGQVIIEWKPRQEKDVKSNKCEGGFLHIHFWITKKRIIDH
ncbi:hypothetical protein GLOIN_2v1799663 [Rhizophagus irregularis DAOM 181602=DAOM 197198]|nr:hypothetical protein GLOIN_2v1799663 [Rhizophagus irregularis DAOM 181602=DAOM 197198]